jgi:hypothetical protein
MVPDLKMHRSFRLITSFGHSCQRVLRRHPDDTVMRRVARDELGDRNHYRFTIACHVQSNRRAAK